MTEGQRLTYEALQREDDRLTRQAEMRQARERYARAREIAAHAQDIAALAQEIELAEETFKPGDAVVYNGQPAKIIHRRWGSLFDIEIDGRLLPGVRMCDLRKT